MYRYLSTLKSYVCNCARLEGSIIEAYIANECLTFYACYLKGGESRYYWSKKNEGLKEHEEENRGQVFLKVGQSYGKIDGFMLDEKTWLQAHRYVLFNCKNDLV